jgi:hypothetical protein
MSWISSLILSIIWVIINRKTRNLIRNRLNNEKLNTRRIKSDYQYIQFYLVALEVKSGLNYDKYKYLQSKFKLNIER